MLGPVLARPPRLGRRPARGARRPHERLDLPLRGARRTAAQHAGADEDDDGERRPVPLARGGGRPGDGLARGRIASTRVLARADGGDRAPGRLGEDLRPSARAGLARGGAGALPADDDRWCPRRRVPADGRLHRSEPAHLRARGGRTSARRGDRHRHARDRRHGRAWPRDRCRDRAGLHRDGDRRQRGRDVRAPRSARSRA